MSIVKVGKSRQVVIPKELWDALNLEAGDFFEVIEDSGRLVFTPKQLVDRDQAAYLSQENQAAMKQALREAKERQGTAYDSVEDAIEDLRS
jgi:AbrB family looped-hinge helix DNA binding protein